MRERLSAETDALAKVRDFMHDLTAFYETLPEEEKKELGVIIIAQDQSLDDENKLASSIGVLGKMMNVASVFGDFEEQHPDILQASQLIKMFRGRQH